jgi:hypothetical protein
MSTRRPPEVTEYLAPTRRAARPEAGPGGTPRPHAAGSRGPDPPRARLHQPRDRDGTRHQRQDGRRACLAHLAQARRTEPARGGRDRAPPLPAAGLTAITPAANAKSQASQQSRATPATGTVSGRPRIGPAICGLHGEAPRHWVRDITFAEDASQLRTGTGPHTMACRATSSLACSAAPGRQPRRCPPLPRSRPCPDPSPPSGESDITTQRRSPAPL